MPKSRPLPQLAASAWRPATKPRLLLPAFPSSTRGKEKLEEILRRVDALPPLDDRPEDEILGYDHEGLPR